MKIDKQRFLDILITALVGAGIAFMQSLITGLSGFDVPQANPEIAGGVAGLWRGIKLFKEYYA
ncbi:MAG: hypothetical protein ACYCZW_00720 [Minisyncoccota bacterium]